MDIQTYTKAELARILGVCTRTIERRIIDGTITVVQLVPKGAVRISYAEVQRILGLEQRENGGHGVPPHQSGIPPSDSAVNSAAEGCRTPGEGVVASPPSPPTPEPEEVPQ